MVVPSTQRPLGPHAQHSATVSPTGPNPQLLAVQVRSQSAESLRPRGLLQVANIMALEKIHFRSIWIGRFTSCTISLTNVLKHGCRPQRCHIRIKTGRRCDRRPASQERKREEFTRVLVGSPLVLAAEPRSLPEVQQHTTSKKDRFTSRDAPLRPLLSGRPSLQPGSTSSGGGRRTAPAG